MELIFELSRKGTKGYRLPKQDVPGVDASSYLGEYYREDLNFPEVSELEVIEAVLKIPHRDVPPADKGTNLFLTQSHFP